MAQLFRFTNNDDSGESVTLTFLLPPQTLSIEGPPEILSRDFTYAGHRWRLMISKRNSQHLSPYLELSAVSPGIVCRIDYSFLLINRASFTQNERFSEKQREFSAKEPRHGARTFIAFNDLRQRKGFTTHKRELLLEVTIRSPHTCYTADLTVHVPSNPHDLDYKRYDGGPFRYGDQDWQLVFCPNMEAEQHAKLRHLIQLRSVGRVETLVKFKYRLTIGASPGRQYKGPVCEELIDYSGNGEGIYLHEDYFKFVEKGMLRISLELVQIYCVSQLKFNLHAGEERNSGQRAPSAICFDKDKQGWTLVAHPNSEYLTFSLFYSDLANVPAGYLRYVLWRSKVVPAARAGDVKPAMAVEPSMDNYYAFMGQPDRGIRVRFPVPMDEIWKLHSPWIDEMDGRLTVEILWVMSQLLVQPTYCRYDDIMRRHGFQMRREVEALQSENNALEKELHNYQQSVANKCASVPPSRAASPAHHQHGAHRPSLSVESATRYDNHLEGLASDVRTTAAVSPGSNHSSSSRRRSRSHVPAGDTDVYEQYMAAHRNSTDSVGPQYESGRMENSRKMSGPAPKPDKYLHDAPRRNARHNYPASPHRRVSSAAPMQAFYE